MKNEHISPKLVNIIFLAPGGSRLERGITQGKFCAPHRTPVKILCKQLENFVEGAVINYKVILSPLITRIVFIVIPWLYLTMQFGFSAHTIFT